MRFKIICFGLFSLSGCASPPPPAPLPPMARPVPVPAPRASPAPPAENWLDRPITQGNWQLGRDALGSFAAFGKPGASADFIVRCMLATKGIKLSRAGAIPENGSRSMTLRAADASKAYNVTNDTVVTPYVSVEIPATDLQLDAIAFSRGRFLVSLDGTSDLVIPDWPEFARVIEDCRGR